MNWKRVVPLLVLDLTIGLASGTAADSGHVPVVCGISFRGPDRQIDLQGFGDLPIGLQQLVNRHIGDRVGSKYASALTFHFGQMMNLDAPSSDQVKDRLARRLYNLIYQFQLSPEQTVNACILLEPNGDFVQALSLPAWAHGAAPPRILTMAEAKSIASTQEMSDSEEIDLRYFADTDTLEWLFSKSTGELGSRVWGKILHIPVENPAGIHWSKWEAIR